MPDNYQSTDDAIRLVVSKLSPMRLSELAQTFHLPQTYVEHVVEVMPGFALTDPDGGDAKIIRMSRK